ncbi:metallophosphoesterase [Phenylobacterium sp.]|uniref:metallophosphoesterase family protein n=1 Tax=Phenylobacterium sp. TaxID=1871053 RepID=UPI002733FA66|nr:metallophosphoesterase [Phenylobacterium sp.]MDP3855595.1 metallophosphoesterase [Phenylobacterium sp.]
MTRIDALAPRGSGHQFLVYGDACSGVPGAPHEATFAAVNAVAAALHPEPEFVLFLGDEIVGLTADEAVLERQWRHWLDREMAWLDRSRTPLWHTTGNHTTYDASSEEMFRRVLRLPDNGPPGQRGLSYFVRRGDLLLVFVHTGFGGEGFVDVDWVAEVLQAHGDAQYKFVLGHHPVHPVNGFSGAYQRDIAPECSHAFWSLLVQAGVAAYLCSHILAFDVQVHQGILQVCTAGAGTAHRMPEGIEYLHCVQAAVDRQGFRYQVLDTAGCPREGLSWPPLAVPAKVWRELAEGSQEVAPPLDGPHTLGLVFSGEAAAAGHGAPQTLFSARKGSAMPSLWVGLRGPAQRLTAVAARGPGRSPLTWSGPSLSAGAPFSIELRLCPEMGPGGLLWRNGAGPWTSMKGAAATGVSADQWSGEWTVGRRSPALADEPFRGATLSAQAALIPATDLSLAEA